MDDPRLTLEGIVRNCDRIAEIVSIMHGSADELDADPRNPAALAMYVTNIREGVSRLSDQFKANHPEILWQSIRMRVTSLLTIMRGLITKSCGASLPWTFQCLEQDAWRYCLYSTGDHEAVNPGLADTR